MERIMITVPFSADPLIYAGYEKFIENSGKITLNYIYNAIIFKLLQYLNRFTLLESCNRNFINLNI